MNENEYTTYQNLWDAEAGGDQEAGAEEERDEGEPRAKKRRLLCVDFASVANYNPAVAQCYLAENDWEMERALNSYFEPSVDESALESRAQIPCKPEACVDLSNEDTTDSTCSKLSSSENIQQEDGSMFSLITWNIDGLNLNNLQERARGVCSYLALYSPDVMFLQEVIPPYYSYLKKRASNYDIITGHEDGYFTAIMLKKSRVKLKSQEIIPFPSTKMMRNLCVRVSVSGNEFYLMTSHLESTKGHAEERINQLKVVLKKMQEAPESATVIIFAGDTNLRDQEVTRCGGLPNNILDVWEVLGKPEHCRYTWDTQMNSNLGIPATCKLHLIESFSEQQQKWAILFLEVWTFLGWKNWTVADFLVITGSSVQLRYNIVTCFSNMSFKSFGILANIIFTGLER